MEMLQEVLSSLGFNVHVALANFFNFLIIFFLLQKFLFKKIGATLEERRKTIEEGVRKSEESETLLVEAKESAKTLIITAEKECERLVKEADEKAKALAIELKNKALLESDAIKDAATKMKDSAYNDGLSLLNEQKEKLFALMFEKVLKEHMTKEKNDSLIASLKK